MAVPLFTHPIYTASLADEARFPKHRYDLVARELRRRGLDHAIVRSPKARRAQILSSHAAAYVDAFLEGRLDPADQRRIGLTPWTPRIVDRTLHLMGGSLAALDGALRQGVGGHMAGGTHHAHRASGSGYCVFNDIPIVVAAARGRGLERALIIDLDVHQGDGTASILQRDPMAFSFSMHCRNNFPFRKARSNFDLALPAGTHDAAYLAALSYHLPRLVELHRPELVIFQAGVDPLAEDHLGLLALTRAGLARRNRVVFEHTAGRRIPTVVLMGGGYARPIEASVAAHADVFEEASRWSFTP
ncbi:MAG: histone deacetylase [Myxococcota bacterium]